MQVQLAKCGKLAELKAELKLLEKNKAKVKEIQKKLKAPERKEKGEVATEPRESEAVARQENRVSKAHSNSIAPSDCLPYTIVASSAIGHKGSFTAYYTDSFNYSSRNRT